MYYLASIFGLYSVVVFLMIPLFIKGIISESIANILCSTSVVSSCLCLLTILIAVIHEFKEAVRQFG